MKNTSIFIPIILIGCLAAVIYLFFTALSASDQDRGGQPDRIVLNEEDYKAPATPNSTVAGTANGGTASGSRTTDGSAGSDNAADYSAYFEEVPEDEKTPAEQENETPARTTTPSPSTRPAATTASRPSATSSGRYLVIAGTFSQADGADTRVAALRAAGFRDARSEQFNRGTYAVALAGQYDRYSRAQRLADEIAGKGFEVKVMKRRE